MLLPIPESILDGPAGAPPRLLACVLLLRCRDGSAPPIMLPLLPVLEMGMGSLIFMVDGR